MRGNDSPDEKPAELPEDFVIDINTADVRELSMLPGIGPSLADAIVDFREQNGEFTSAEDIMDVPGIGEAKFSAVEKYISAG